MGKNYDEYEDDIIEKDSPRKSKKQENKKSKNKKQANTAGSKALNTKKKKKKRSFKAKFFMFLTVLLTICCIAVSAFIVCFYLGVFNDLEIKSGTEDQDGDSPISAFTNMIMPTLPERTTFLIAGTDADGTRTDTIMTGCYNSELEELTLVSIPRDTLVEVDDETYNLMRAHYPEPGQHGMKINALHHYGTSTDDENDDRQLGLSFLKKWVENEAGTDIDYVVRVNFEAFTYLIDSIGGIEYDVPIRMYYKCDDLMIDLQPGFQTLNGEQAEGLVRFRHDYVNGDIGRVEQQQAFMKALIKQLANKDTIFGNLNSYITTFFKYIDTDMTITDAVKFATVFKNFNTDNVVTYTLPGEVGSLYGISGGYVMDEAETKELFNEIFIKPSSQIKQERAAAAEADAQTALNATRFNDKELEIQILNGSYANGVATKAMTELTSLGYNAMSTGTYNGEKTKNTRIYVKEDGMAASLADNFPGCEFIVDTNVEFTEKYDVVIILGTGE